MKTLKGDDRFGFLSLIFLFACLFWFSPAVEAQFTYTTSGGVATITGYNGPGGIVNIPTTIGGYQVVAVGNYSLYFQPDITSVIMPSGLTSIGTGAFLNCAGLTNITLPSTLTNVSTGAFAGCTNLDSVVIPAGLTSIASETFAGCFNLTNISLPSTVTNIGSAAFASCGFTNAYIPAAVSYVASNAFMGCPGLVSYTVDPNNPSYSSQNGVLFDKSQATLIAFPVAKPGYYTMPGSVTGMVDHAFDSCTGVTGVAASPVLTNISNYGFNQCPNLTSITIPDSVAVIETLGFYDCSNLASVTFGKGLTNIEDWAFGYCINLQNLKFPVNLTTIGTSSFYYCQSLIRIQLPANITAIGLDAFSFSTNLSEVILPKSLSTISDEAFFYCLGLQNVFFAGSAPLNLHPNPEQINPIFASDGNATIYYLPGTSGWSNSYGSAPTALWNPIIQGGGFNFAGGSNSFGFQITGSSNLPVAVEACTNLANPVWTSLTNATLTQGSFYFNDPTWTNNAARFYGLGFP